MNIHTISKEELANYLIESTSCQFKIDPYTGDIFYYIQADYKGNILTDCPWADDVFESKLCKVQDLDFSDISEHRIRKIFEKETLEDPDFSRMLDQFLLQFKSCKCRFI